MDGLRLASYDGSSYQQLMDTLFFISINAGLLVLLFVGLTSAKNKIKAGRKELA